MTDIIIKRSTKKDKKFDAIFQDGKKISFGAKGYNDFTISQDID